MAEMFLSLHDVGEELGVSVQTVRRWVKAGELAAYKPGKEYRIKSSDLEEFLKTREVGPKAPPPRLEEEVRRRRVKEAKVEILAEEGPFYGAYEVQGYFLAAEWRKELERLKESPGIRIGTLKAGDYHALVQFTWDLFTNIAVYETAAAEAGHPQHPRYEAALQEMKAVRQEAAETVRPILDHLKDRQDTNAEFRKILEEGGLEDLLSQAESR